MSGIQKTIYLARHAKSSWDSDAVSDFDRPLSHRGQKDAVNMGKELKRLEWLPEKIISSPAIRAKQTCHNLCEGMGLDSDEVVWDKDIYAAYVISLLHILSNLPEQIQSIMLIGHNPAIEDLLVHLCGEASLRRSFQKNGKLFTTGNVAKISVSVSWKGLVMSEAELEGLLRPKEIT